MKKLSFLLLLVTVIIYSCTKQSDIQGTGTVYVDVPPNGSDYFGSSMDEPNQKATLGRVLFYERRLSLNNSVACASCHRQDAAFSDRTALSRGYENRLTRRNSMAIQNLGFSGGGIIFNPFQTKGSFFWDARETNLQNLISRPISNHIEMGIDDVSKLPERIADLPYYPDLFKKAYGTDEITVDKIAEAMTTFLIAIRSDNTRFDQMNQGLGSFTALELEGQNLFNTKYNCNGCQVFPQAYSSAQFMNIGLEYPNVDKGLGAVTNNAQLNGVFKIPNLRNVAMTAPYMHDGRFPTLENVLEHYSHGIQNDPNLDERLRTANGQPLRMNISDNEKKALIAFLNTLTDYNMLTDEKFSDPFKVK